MTKGEDGQPKRKIVLLSESSSSLNNSDPKS